MEIASLSHIEIKRYDNEGLFPGPNETEDEFRRRAEFCLNLRSEWEKIANQELPFQIDDGDSKNILKEAEAITEILYGIFPTWVPLFFSNFKLAPWLGGCAWIFQLDDKSPTSAFLQLRSAFRNQSRYLGIYDRSELIAHELSHVGRMMYQEPKFEELFAYQSSPSLFRRWTGPIFQSTYESFFLVFLLLLTIFVNLAAPSLIWVNLLPFFFVVMLGVRLAFRHNKLNKCKKNLQGLINEPSLNPLIYRLTDHEILTFAKSSTESIKIYIDEEQTFRWKFLRQVYITRT